MVPIEISSPRSYSTYIHTTGLSCTVLPQYTTWQTDDRLIERWEKHQRHKNYYVADNRVPIGFHGITVLICNTFTRKLIQLC